MKQDSDPCSCLLQLPGTNYTQITPETVLIKLLEHTVEKVLTIATSGVLHQVCFNHPSPSSNYTHDNLGKEFKLTDQDNFLCEAEFSVLKSLIQIQIQIQILIHKR